MKFHKIKFTKKRLFTVVLALILLIGLGFFMYLREYQTLPDFVMPIMSEMPKPHKDDKILIFAPHADDETLGVGGYIADAVKSGSNIKVVLITNGDGHRISTVEQFKKIYPNSKDYIKSGYDRQQESTDALKVLGLSAENIIFLGYPDGGLRYLLEKNWQRPYRSPFTKTASTPYNNSYRIGANYTGQDLQTDMAKVINDFSPNIVFVTSPDDIHPDHRSAAYFVQKALVYYQQKYSLYYYLIHFRNFPRPKGLHPNRLLTPPLKLFTIYDGWLKYTLKENELSLKEDSIKQYASQYKEPFLKSLMQGFAKQNELYHKGN